MTTPDPEQIAAGLTKAQRVAVTCWDDCRELPPERIGWLLDNITDAEIRDVRNMGLATKPTNRPPCGSFLTPLGLAVRNIVKDQTND